MINILFDYYNHITLILEGKQNPRRKAKSRIAEFFLLLRLYPNMDLEN
jgi:hypothetical protein